MNSSAAGCYVCIKTMYGHLAFKFGKALTPFKRKKMVHVNQVAYFMCEGRKFEIFGFFP